MNNLISDLNDVEKLKLLDDLVADIHNNVDPKQSCTSKVMVLLATQTVFINKLLTNDNIYDLIYEDPILNDIMKVTIINTSLLKRYADDMRILNKKELND